DAFAIQVQYDFHHHRATIQATISAVAVPHINRLAQAATDHHTPDTSTSTTATSENAPSTGGQAAPQDHLQIYDMPRRGHLEIRNTGRSRPTRPPAWRAVWSVRGQPGLSEGHVAPSRSSRCGGWPR